MSQNRHGDVMGRAKATALMSFVERTFSRNVFKTDAHRRGISVELVDLCATWKVTSHAVDDINVTSSEFRLLSDGYLGRDGG